MRTGFIIVGIIIAALGVAAFIGKFNFNQDKEVLKIGDVSASVQQEKTVPQWIGGIGIIVGLGLIVVGATRKS
ncbi:MAG TPA: hypothetical protein VFG55_02550 [Rhodanobacteraceae bacterium]|nr:hypothetical protein [Rhodanobacteraceae bacterium]